MLYGKGGLIKTPADSARIDAWKKSRRMNKTAGNFEESYLEKEGELRKRLLMRLQQVGPKVKKAFKPKPRKKTPLELIEEFKANPKGKLDSMTS